ncbi:MAG TPA: glycosyltransferase 87 family protein, partial [Candidatus Caenarcaniphilales bacterium]|nr:glycosyltransferase 87 family protein [Candidatus Caenarcaniphilales bacterium]
MQTTSTPNRERWTRRAFYRLAPRHRAVVLALGVLLAAATLAAVVAGAEPLNEARLGPGYDGRAYWEAARGTPYGRQVGVFGAYLYSPAFLQAFALLGALPWELFLGLWTAIALGALALMVGPLLFAPLLAVAFPEVWGGNIHLLMAAAIVVGFRWPAAWAFVLLTKVTPGIGLLWFAVRGEWRSLATAVAATGAVAFASWLFVPTLWAQWIGVLVSNSAASTVAGSVPIALEVRLPLAVGVVVYGARRNHDWLVPIAAMLALPVLWWGGLSMIVGAVALRRRTAETLL